MLFPRAVTVEGYEEEERNHGALLTSDFDDEGEEEGQYVLFKEQSPGRSLPRRAKAASLRLLVDETVAMHVKSISYDVSGAKVRRIREVDGEDRF